MEIINITFPKTESKSIIVNFESFIKSFIRCEANDEEDIVLEFGEPECLKQDKLFSVEEHGWIAASESPAKTYITLNKVDNSVTLSLWVEPMEISAKYALELLCDSAELGKDEFDRVSSELNATVESFEKGQVLVIFYDVILPSDQIETLKELAK